MKKKLLSIALVLAMACTSIVGCGKTTSNTTTTNTAAATTETKTITDSAAATTTPAADEKIKIGVSIWSSTDVLGSQCKLILDKAAEALGVEVQYVDQGHVSEKVTASVEQLCAAGCQGIVICNSSDTEMASAIKTCNDNGVYLAQFFRIISQENSADIYQAGVEKWNAAHPDDQAVLSEPQYAGTSSEGGSKAAEALMSANPNLDALIPAGGGGDPLQGAIAAVERAGKTDSIDIVSTDFLPDLGERLSNGSMAGESGGHYCDPLFAFMAVYNAIKGNYSDFGGKFEDINFPYLYVASPDDYTDYEKYFVDQLPYTSEELVEMSKLDMAGLKAKAAGLSIEDAAARSGK